MKLIISQSQLKNITQKVILEQFSSPEDYNIGNLINKSNQRAQYFKDKEKYEKENPDKKNYSQGRYILQTNKGWYSGTPLEKWLHDDRFFPEYPTGSLDHASEKFDPYDYNGEDYIYNHDKNDKFWYFFENGNFEINNGNECIGKWSYGPNSSIIIVSPTCGTFSSLTHVWDKNVNCAKSLDEIKEGSTKILKYGCKNDAVKELQKLLNMEQKYQTGYFGPITKGKVTEFQQSKGLKVDGIVGPKTYVSLTTQPETTPTDTSGLGVDDIDQFNKQQTNEYSNRLTDLDEDEDITMLDNLFTKD